MREREVKRKFSFALPNFLPFVDLKNKRYFTSNNWVILGIAAQNKQATAKTPGPGRSKLKSLNDKILHIEREIGSDTDNDHTFGRI